MSESILVPSVACHIHISNAEESVLAYLAELSILILRLLDIWESHFGH